MNLSDDQLAQLDANVARGVEFLDLAVPDWWHVEDLQMEDGCKCVWGQLVGRGEYVHFTAGTIGYELAMRAQYGELEGRPKLTFASTTGFALMLEAMKVVNPAANLWMVSHGFMLPDFIDEETGAIDNALDHIGWAYLESLWEAHALDRHRDHAEAFYTDTEVSS